MEPIFVCNTPLIVAGNMGGTLTSVAFDISEINNYAVQFSWTGSTPIGTVNVLISCDGVGFDLLSTAKNLSGNSGTLIVKDSNAGYKFIKAVFTYGSGSGTLNASISGKRV